MALFGKDREPRAFPGGPAGSAPDPAPLEVEMFERDQKTGRPEEATGTSAFLGKGTKITGKLAFEGSVRIEGHIEGEISCEDTLTIGEGAVVKAKIAGTTVVVHGQVNGDIAARTKLELRAPSKVTGNINAPSLVIHEGAVFEGQCTMGAAGAPRAKKPDFSVLLRSGDADEEPPPSLQPDTH
jgi:cytoskeletal protein CcmA (bactofilin family)